MVWGDDPVLFTEELNKISIIIGPSRITMDHDDNIFIVLHAYWIVFSSLRLCGNRD